GRAGAAGATRGSVGARPVSTGLLVRQRGPSRTTVDGLLDANAVWWAALRSLGVLPVTGTALPDEQAGHAPGDEARKRLAMEAEAGGVLIEPGPAEDQARAHAVQALRRFGLVVVLAAVLRLDRGKHLGRQLLHRGDA